MRILQSPAAWLAGIVLAFLSGCRLTVQEGDIFRPPMMTARFAAMPFTYTKGAPWNLNVAVEPVEICVDDGVRLRGYFYHAPGSPRYALFVNGNAATVQSTRRAMAWMSRTFGLNVLCLDYRGYGFSDRSPPTFARVTKDCLIACDWLAGRALSVETALNAAQDSPSALESGLRLRPAAPRPRLFVVGYSLGAGFAADVASERELDGVVLIAAPTSVEDVVCARLLPWWLQPWFVVTPSEAARNYRPQPIDSVRSIEEPVLIIHSRDDAVIPIELGRKLFNATAARDKRFCEAGGRHEVLPILQEPVIEALAKFLDDVSSRSRPRQAPTSQPAD